MSDKNKQNNFLSLALRIVVSVGLLWFIFSKIDIQKTLDVVRGADIRFLICAFFVFLIIHGILLLRWNFFIRALGLQASLFDIIRFFFVGLFGNLFLPSSIGGDAIKIIGLCKNSDQKPKVIASVLLDRLSGFASIVLVAVGSFIFGYRFIDDKSLIVPIVIMAGASLGIAGILFNGFIYEFCCRIFNRWPKIKDSLMKLHYDISLLKDRKAYGYGAIGMSCLSQIILAFVFYLIARALHQEISIIYFLIFVPMICIASSFPSIGGLGVREAGAVYLFSKVGISSAVAVSMSLINYMFMVAVGLLGGLIYAALYSRRV